MAAKLFTAVDLGGVALPNRIVVWPMCQYSAIDASAQGWHQLHYGMLSMSGAGLLCVEPRGSARRPASRPGRVGVITEPEQAERIVASGEADCTAHARAFLLDPRWAWNAAPMLGVETPPLPLPAVRATTILPFKPQPALMKAAD
jgi:2,4-dienoyl-CoA reductase-like NADH-dependent reductase (Old Yellow Enzyme family)